MTSSTTPSVFNVLQRRERGTKPWLQSTCIENFVMFVVSEIYMQRYRLADRQTDRWTHLSQFFILPYGEVIISNTFHAVIFLHLRISTLGYSVPAIGK